LTTVAVRSSERQTSPTGGVLYLVTFASIPTLALYRPREAGGLHRRQGTDTAATIEGVLEIIVALASIATTVVLFPVVGVAFSWRLWRRKDGEPPSRSGWLHPKPL